MRRKKILAVIGARPQFIKHYPFQLAADRFFDLHTIHTGQHYDHNMSGLFFDQLGMRKPEHLLQLGGGTHGLQTGKMLIEIEQIILKTKPDFVVVYGDTNSTLAGALAAAKLHIPIVHIEAGLRSFNKTMPEEINRVMTDHISTLLFVPSPLAQKNLAREGIEKGVHIVGDIMKDVLMTLVSKGLVKKRLESNPYYYATLHRPFNVDRKDRLNYILDQLNQLDNKVILSMHPRTLKNLKDFNLEIHSGTFPNIQAIEAQGYIENLNLLYNAQALITDSGGMQKEAYWLKINCATIRPETEWLETLENNANKLFFEDLKGLNEQLSDQKKTFDETLYGDGKSSQKMISILQNYSLVN